VGFVRVLLAAVLLGGVFGSATATIESIDGDLMMLSIEVEVSGSPDTVIAHLTFEDDQALILPLLDRGDGTFGLRTELEPKNYFVVFEVFGEGTETSDPVSLAQMGAEFGPRSGGTTTTMPEDELSDESRRALWLAVALGAGSLSLLAVWVLGSRDEDEEEDVEKHDDSEEEE
jgi:hypothetical protein